MSLPSDEWRAFTVWFTADAKRRLDVVAACASRDPVKARFRRTTEEICNFR